MGTTPFGQSRIEFLDEQSEPVRSAEKVERVKDSLENISAMLSWAYEELADFAQESPIGAHVILELECLQKQLAENIKTLDEVA